MSHVGIERLRSRNDKKDSAQDHKTMQFVHNKKPDGIPGKNRKKNLWVMCDLHKS